MTTATRPIRFIPEPAIESCPEHGPQCYQLCICAVCGQDRRIIRDLTNGHAAMTTAQRHCWSGHPVGA